jgi:hypothetical protein
MCKVKFRELNQSIPTISVITTRYKAAQILPRLLEDRHYINSTRDCAGHLSAPSIERKK